MLLQLSPVSCGQCFSAGIRDDGPDEYQDLDTFRYCAVDLSLLYPAGGGEIIRFQGVYCDSALFLSARTDDRAPRAGVCSFARWAPIHCPIPDGPRRLIRDKT